ncbi:hypothetical protein [Tomitella gaofuii]|uniref:hypothetical protein n=1 Tax=Tomitella gaofuii TaxID=2760083 RepID=UPI0015F877AB|nr:hypothetical protein [Tomitella gaofuii]
MDPAQCIVNHTITAMREAFTPGSSQPPIGGGSDAVRLLAGDTLPLAVWNAHNDSPGCDEPFLWVRLARRFRTRKFPAVTVEPDPCGLPKAIEVEVGVGRCAYIDPDGATDWDALAREAEISLDDSWRIELALCRAIALTTGDQCATATASADIVPFGPEGGILAWSGTLYAQL